MAGLRDPGALKRIAYFGPQGTFSEEALLSEADLATCDLVGLPTIAEAIGAIGHGEVDGAFVPIENSIEGSVNATIDELVFGDDLLIQREVVLAVHLDLLVVPGTTLEQVRRVVTFPHASAQCRAYLGEHLPRAEIAMANSTADAARLVAEEAQPQVAAIASGLAGKLYHLEVLAHAIEDHADNETRFVLIGRDAIPARSGHDRTAIVCFQSADRPGSLHEILGQFAARSLNLTRIESRPTKRALGDYCFIIEFDGHLDDEVVVDCLRELRAEIGTVKFLGSYPVSGEAASALRGERDEQRKSADRWLAELRKRIQPSE